MVVTDYYLVLLLGALEFNSPAARSQNKYMKILFNPFCFVAQVLSRSDPEVQGNDDHLKESVRSSRILLLSLRSPSDQLHFVAINPYPPNERNRPVHPYSSS
jgi:hypothetical protein